MDKKNKGRKFSRPKSQRIALLRALATNLFMREKITTTEAKAKELRSVAEKMITRAKANSLADKRLLAKEVHAMVVKKLTVEIAPKYAKRQGGYTRITRLGPRKSDGANMAIIELVK